MDDAGDVAPAKKTKNCDDYLLSNEYLPVFNLKYEERDLQEMAIEMEVASYVSRSLVYPYNVHCMLCMKTCSVEMTMIAHIHSYKHLVQQCRKKEAIGIISKEFNTFIMCCLSDLIAFVHVYYRAVKLNEIVVANQEFIFSENAVNIAGEPETSSRIMVNSPGFIHMGVENTVFFQVIVDQEDIKLFNEGRAATYSHLTGNLVIKARGRCPPKIAYVYELFTEGIPSSGPLFINILSWCSENIPDSTLVWCSLCSNVLTIESLASHLSSEGHISSRYPFLYGLMCHKCETFFLIPYGNKMNHVHTRASKKTLKNQTNKKFNSIHLMSDISADSIDMYINEFTNKYSLKDTDFRFQCLLCFSPMFSFYDDFLGHLNDSSHLNKLALEGRKFVVFYDTFNTMLITQDKNRIFDHFELYESPNKIITSNRKPSTSTSCNSNVLLQPRNSIHLPPVSSSVETSTMFPKVAYFSETSFQITDPGIQNDFTIIRDFTCENLEEYIAETFYSVYSDLKTLYFACLNCSSGKTDKDLFFKHLKNKEHLSRTLPYAGLIFFVKICDICQVFLLGSHVALLGKHFTSQEHKLSVKHIMDVIKMQYIENSGKTKLRWSGKLTEKSKDLFSSEGSLSKCVESALKEADEVNQSAPFIHGILEKDIKKILEPIYGTMDIQFFGSRIYGLAQRNSDVDIYLNLGQAAVEDLENAFSNSMSLFSAKETIKEDVVPVIKVEHIYTSLDCDINCSYSAAAYNSELIKVYISLDYRVPWVLTAVREWASANQIRGTEMFTSFALIWLVLFFLMQPDICLIPPANLLKDIYKGEKKIINGLDYSFTRDTELIKAHHNPLACSKSKNELLFLFFKYYAMLKGERVILMPLTGEVYTRSAVVEAGSSLFPELILNIEDTEPLRLEGDYILLDCFCLKYNILKTIDVNLADHFRLICKKTSEDSCWKTAGLLITP